MAQLGPDWRPDLSGVMLRTDTSAEGHPEVYFQLIAGYDVINNAGLAGVVGGMAQAGVAVYLVVPGRPGTDPAKVPLNAGLAPAIANRDLRQLVAALNEALRAAIRLHRSLGTAPDAWR
jgi:hypothetical protein